MDTSKLFDGVATATLIIFAAGALGGTQTGKGFDLSPFSALLNQRINPETVSNEPLTDVAKRAGERVKNGTIEAIATAANDQTDPRLAACREGSVEPRDEITMAEANAVKTLNLNSFIEVQGHLGEPHCNEQTKWVYLIEGGKTITFNEQSGGINATIR